MAAQHKRPGRVARLERIRRAQERERAKKVVIITGRPTRNEQYCPLSPGRLVAWAEVAVG